MKKGIVWTASGSGTTILDAASYQEKKERYVVLKRKKGKVRRIK